MLATIELALSALALAKQAADVGISIFDIWVKARAAIDSVSAPGNAAWDEADAACKALEARALDPATDLNKSA